MIYKNTPTYSEHRTVFGENNITCILFGSRLPLHFWVFGFPEDNFIFNVNFYSYSSSRITSPFKSVKLTSYCQLDPIFLQFCTHGSSINFSRHSTLELAYIRTLSKICIDQYMKGIFLYISKFLFRLQSCYAFKILHYCNRSKL